MPNLDQFESVFKSASKTVFAYERIDFPDVLCVTDLDDTRALEFEGRIRQWLGVLGGRSRWRNVAGREFETVEDLLGIVKKDKPDLICTYRNLHSSAWKWPYSLGCHLDVLTQFTKSPVLVVPHPEAGREREHAMKKTESVMAVTNHLVGDHRLVNYAARFTQENGTLFLTHVESRTVFERYVDTISRIPSINTDLAREEIAAQLLKEPKDYIRSCREKLEEAKLPIRVEEVVTMGRRLEEYKRLVESHAIDLLVMNTKDEGQLAMQGIAYELAVELRGIPLLLI